MEPEDSQSVDHVRSTLEDLHKLTSAVRLYGLEHPKTVDVATRFAGRLHPLLRAYGELELRVARDGLYWQGEDVYTDDDERDGLARTLHREGIVRLTFLPGLVRDELLTFAEVIGTNLNLPRWEEETLTSLLWQARFEHVLYEAVEYLSDAQEMSETAAVGEETYVQEILRMILQPDPLEPGRGAGAFGAVPSRAASRDDDVDEATLDEEAGGPAGQRPDAGEARARMAVPDPTWTPAQHIAALDLSQWAEAPEAELERDVDLEAIRREIEADNVANLLRRVMEILIIGGSQGRPELLPEMAMSLVDRGLEHEEAGGARMWPYVVGLVDRVLVAELPLLEPGRETMERWLDLCTTPGRFRALASHLAPDNADHQRLVKRLLRAHDGRRARLLAERIGGVEQRRFGWIVDEVARVVGSDVLRMSAGLDRRPVDEVLPMLDLMRRMGGAAAGERIAALLRHRAPEVRAAAIRALPDPVAPQVVTRVLDLLTDRDRGVRQAAVDLLRARDVGGAFGAIQVLIRGKRYEGAPPEIKRTLAEALAVTGRDAAIPLLLEIAGRHKGLFGGAAARADMEACARGLARIESVHARQALSQGARSLNPAMRRAFRDALEGKGRAR